MSRGTGLSHHPAPHGEKLPTAQAFFMLFGGPIAWLVQLCASFALLGWSCYPMMDRYPAPMPNYAWSRVGAYGLLGLCLLIALGAGTVGLIKLRQVRRETDGDHAKLIEVGMGRTRFTALWGVVLGFGFALASALTLAPFLMVSRCAG